MKNYIGFFKLINEVYLTNDMVDASSAFPLVAIRILRNEPQYPYYNKNMDVVSMQNHFKIKGFLNRFH